MSVIAVGADHAGYELKETIAAHLVANDHQIVDCGTHSLDRVDYPEFGAAVANAVIAGEAERGIVVFGSGMGIFIAAGNITRKRAATLHHGTTA
ncbi:MAG: RpiB/LacA/LacB family sugar-phosphate isomerase, partial [Actinomycetota bacterium]|nr:RpiB/LacA/LacB family sugar-phosphate isomerase [Actinomycetota bacterium]